MKHTLSVLGELTILIFANVGLQFALNAIFPSERQHTNSHAMGIALIACIIGIVLNALDTYGHLIPNDLHASLDKL